LGERNLQALHALGLADPNLCMPPKDVAQFVRALAPYLKVLICSSDSRLPLVCPVDEQPKAAYMMVPTSPGSTDSVQSQTVQEEAAGKKDHKQRAAECLLCIMSLLSALLSRLDHVDKYECCGNLQP
jgi:hypothetical protein